MANAAAVLTNGKDTWLESMKAASMPRDAVTFEGCGFRKLNNGFWGAFVPTAEETPRDGDIANIVKRDGSKKTAKIMRIVATVNGGALVEIY